MSEHCSFRCESVYDRVCKVHIPHARSWDYAYEPEGQVRGVEAVTGSESADGKGSARPLLHVAHRHDGRVDFHGVVQDCISRAHTEEVENANESGTERMSAGDLFHEDRSLAEEAAHVEVVLASENESVSGLEGR